MSENSISSSGEYSSSYKILGQFTLSIVCRMR